MDTEPALHSDNEAGHSGQKTLVMSCKCARCGEDITTLYYYDGKYYGYSCIKIVAPQIKRTAKIKVVEADSYTITPTENTSKSIIVAIVGGVKHKDILFHNLPDLGSILIIGNKAYLRQFN